MPLYYFSKLGFATNSLSEAELISKSKKAPFRVIQEKLEKFQPSKKRTR